MHLKELEGNALEPKKDEGRDVMLVLEELRQAIINGDINEAGQRTMMAINCGFKAVDIINKAMVPAIQRVGEFWVEGRYFLPEVIMSAEALKEAMGKARLHLSNGEMPSRGRILIGTVEGDMYDLGKNIVAAMLEGAGFQVIDLGVDVEVALFVAKARELKPDILGIGAYLSTTMLTMRDVIKALDTEGLRNGVKVLIGGAPVTQKYADGIGADFRGR